MGFLFNINTLGDEIREYQFQNFWSRVKKGVIFRGAGDEIIEIVNPGVWNKEEGPDFKNAVLKINGIVREGDIEVHLSASDWKNHGHFNDLRYKNVILHVVQKVSANYDIDLTTVIIPDGLIAEYNSKNIDKYPKGYCSEMFKEVSDEKLGKIFVSAGIERFMGKANLCADDILKYGVNSAVIKRLFDSMGYKKNREQFLALYNRLFEYDLENLTQSEISAVLWGESGMLPDPVQFKSDDVNMNDFITEKWELWWKLRIGNREKIVWKLSGVRPQNHPVRRIAALDSLFFKFGVRDFFTNILSVFEKHSESSNFWKDFKHTLAVNNNLWEKYSDFNSKISKSVSVLGESRLLDITVNVLMPVIFAYCKINNNTFIIKLADIYLNLPKGQKNIIIDMSAERWLIPKERSSKVIKTAAAQQGVIYLYKNYCSSLNMHCSKCEIPELLNADK